jgi:hypothetical protein
MILSANKKVMGVLSLPWHISFLGWLATLAMLLAVTLMFLQF